MEVHSAKVEVLDGQVNAEVVFFTNPAVAEKLKGQGGTFSLHVDDGGKVTCRGIAVLGAPLAASVAGEASGKKASGKK